MDPEKKLSEVIDNVHKIFKECIEDIFQCVDRYFPDPEITKEQSNNIKQNESTKKNHVLEDMREDMLGVER